MSILILDPGLLTTIQDYGRYGYQEHGVSPSGAMDQDALYECNILVGNAPGEAAVEMTLSGPTLRFNDDCIAAITGASMDPRLNGQPVPQFQAFVISAGDELSFGFASNGIRTYLAISGGLDIPEVMGSRSTLLSSRLGGYEGRSLQQGDTLRLRNPGINLRNIEERVLVPHIYDTQRISLRLIRGPQADDFPVSEYRRFFNYEAVLTDQCDRQGYRLHVDVPIKHSGSGNIISDGISFGSIQVPPDGQPFILMAEHQTVGGYPKIGTVASVDLPKLAQARPGMKLAFIEISIQLSQELYRRRNKRLQALYHQFNQGGDYV